MVKAYTVLSEFKFEVGGALANTNKVTGAVEGLSKAAGDAKNDLLTLGTTFVGTFGLGATSFLGLMGKGLTAFDKFRASQLQFANLISSNMHVLGGDIDTFNDRLNVSKKILQDISGDAIKFGLPEDQLLGLTKLMSAALIPKGLAGDNFSEARDISRNLLKSAPSLGIDPGLIQGQLFRAIEGGASMGDTLFRRLALETKAFQDQFKGATNAAKAFNRLPLKERFELLKQGMSQFSSDADVLAGNALTLGSMFQRVRDLFGGINGILKPIGEAVMPLLIQVFQKFVSYVDNQGRRVIEEFSSVFQMMVTDVESAIISLGQAQRLSKDFKAASGTAGGFMILDFLASLFGWFRIGSVAIGAFLIAFKGFNFAFSLLGRVLLFLMPLLKIVVLGILEFAAALGPILFIFQTISRAMAMAKLQDVKMMPEIMARFAEQTKVFMGVMMIFLQPLIDFSNYLAGKISFLFQYSFWLEFVVNLFEKFNRLLIDFGAIMRGFVFSVLQAYEDIKNLNFSGMWDRMAEANYEGAKSFLDELNAKTKDDAGVTNTSKQTTYMNVNMYNQFKEQMQPDRIAVALQDQLFKAATNPRQAKGRSLPRASLAED